MAFSLAKELSNCCCCCEQLRLMQPTLTKTDDRVGKFSAKIIRKLSVSTRSSNFFFLGGGGSELFHSGKRTFFLNSWSTRKSFEQEVEEEREHKSSSTAQKSELSQQSKSKKNEITGGHQVSMNCVFSKCHLQLMLTIHFLHSIYHFSETPFNTN